MLPLVSNVVSERDRFQDNMIDLARNLKARELTEEKYVKSNKKNVTLTKDKFTGSNFQSPSS